VLLRECAGEPLGNGIVRRANEILNRDKILSVSYPCEKGTVLLDPIPVVYWTYAGHLINKARPMVSGATSLALFMS
jgi:hypothetical protein